MWNSYLLSHFCPQVGSLQRPLKSLKWLKSPHDLRKALGHWYIWGNNANAEETKHEENKCFNLPHVIIKDATKLWVGSNTLMRTHLSFVLLMQYYYTNLRQFNINTSVFLACVGRMWNYLNFRERETIRKNLHHTNRFICHQPSSAAKRTDTC